MFKKLNSILVIIGFVLTANHAAWAEDIRVVNILKELIEADTTNPPGSELRGVLVLEKWLKQIPNIELERLESEPGRTSLIARIHGKGDQPALILLGHIDVVAADPKEWKHPPFKATIADNYVWGRGAIDMKGMLAMQVDAMLNLSEQKKSFNGDLILVATADEETGGAKGAEWLLTKRPDLLKAGWVLNEGSIGVRRENFDIFPIQVAEKGVCWLRLTSQGRSGHGSMPDKDNAALKLITAMDVIGNYRFPLQATPVTKEFLRSISSQFSFPQSFVLKNLFQPLIGLILRPLARPQIAKDRAIHAILTHTAAPTRLTAGNKVNVIPHTAEGYVDARILPGTTPVEFRNFLQGLVGNEVKLEIVTSSLPNETQWDTPFYRALARSLKKHFPEAVITPIMSAGATDSRFFRDAGVPAYGLIPALITEEDLEGLHGKNERIPIKGLKTGVKIITEVIDEVL